MHDDPNLEMAISLATPLAEKQIFKNNKKDETTFGGSLRHFAPQAICTLATIKSFKKSSSDYYKLIILGKNRIILNTITQNIPYPIFFANNIFDINETKIFSSGTVERLGKIMSSWLNTFITDSIDRETIQNKINCLSILCDHISHLIVNDIEIKQILLKKTSIHEKVQILSSLLKDPDPFSIDSETAKQIKEFNNK